MEVTKVKQTQAEAHAAGKHLIARVRCAACLVLVRAAGVKLAAMPDDDQGKIDAPRPAGSAMARKVKGEQKTETDKALDKAMDDALAKAGLDVEKHGPPSAAEVGVLAEAVVSGKIVPLVEPMRVLPKKARGKKAIEAAKAEVATPAPAQQGTPPPTTEQAVPVQTPAAMLSEALGQPVVNKTLEQIANEMPPAPASEEQKAMIDLAAQRELALRRFAARCEATWKEYGIDQTALDREMTHDKEQVEVQGDKIRHLGYKKQGLGQTLAMHLAKYRAKISKAADPTALAEAERKAETTVLDVALYLWAQGSATGPITQLSLGNAAKAAERLADSLEKMGKVVNAQQQRERAERLREQAERVGKGLAVEVDKIKPKTTIADVKAGGKGGADKPANASGKCLCGCGAETRGNFKPGHDSKVHGLALKIARGQSADHLPMGAAEYVQRSKWLSGAERAKFLEHHNIKEG